ncbi:MAG: LysM peptidoglycan-binding domain-containing protein [Candidatus Levybacteria bacterium]|nr:LysM peptidoglycan-binding domain-containing protein [Candidatus Levybacteria bacterium]
MPRKKTAVNTTVQLEKISNSLGQFKLGESYISLLLGVFVVVIAGVLLTLFTKNRNLLSKISLRPEIASQKTQDLNKSNEPVYVVASGDTLWSIAEKAYKSGYNWETIVKANNISNPDLIEIGTKLSLPKIESAIANNSPGSITGSSYTVKEGDDLWDVAVRAYGDGFQWVKIAQANNLDNPDVIHSDNVLKIPR